MTTNFRMTHRNCGLLFLTILVLTHATTTIVTPSAAAGCALADGTLHSPMDMAQVSDSLSIRCELSICINGSCSRGRFEKKQKITTCLIFISRATNSECNPSRSIRVTWWTRLHSILPMAAKPHLAKVGAVRIQRLICSVTKY